MERKKLIIFISILLLLLIAAGSVYEINNYLIKQTANQIGSVPVLLYHSISDDPIGWTELSVRKRDFERQMKYLSDNGYTTLRFNDLKNIGRYKKPVIITFDDGYSDNYYNAYPILKKYNLKATIFVVVKNINKKGFLTKTQIAKMSDLISFQSHTISHLELTKVSDTTLEKECSLSKSTLSGITKKPVYVLSYPVGKYNNKVIEAASKYYDYAVTEKTGYYNKAFGNYTIKRLHIWRFYSLKRFISKL